MNLQGWLPAQFFWRGDQARVLWTLMGRKRLLEPFYEGTLRQQMSEPFHQMFARETSMDDLVEWAATHPPLRTGGLIFHLSRCGSTLISQMLARSERAVVASEPGPLDAVLRARLTHPELSAETHLRWVRAMAVAIAQPRAGDEDAFYLKLDCWNLHQIELLREVFPDAPWIFLYRDPLEIMVSHDRMPAAWTVPGLLHPLALRLDLEDWVPSEPEAYRARALRNIAEAGLRATAAHGGLLVNYTELPDAMYGPSGRVYRHFGLSEDYLPALRAGALRDAKSPHATFTSDSQEKQEGATDRVRAATAEFLQPLYEQLQAARLAKMPKEPSSTTGV